MAYKMMIPIQMGNLGQVLKWFADVDERFLKLDYMINTCIMYNILKHVLIHKESVLGKRKHVEIVWSLTEHEIVFKNPNN